MNKWLLTLGLVGSAGQALAADTIAPTVTASVAPGNFRFFAEAWGKVS